MDGNKENVEDLGPCETQPSGLRGSCLPAQLFSAYGPGLRKAAILGTSPQKLTERHSETIRLEWPTVKEVADWCPC